MKNTERFDRAMSALVKGYMNETLGKGSCAMCAVGNIVAAGMNFDVCRPMYPPNFEYIWKTSDNLTHIPRWGQVFATSGGIQFIRQDEYRYGAQTEIDSTGYSWQELALVEKAFEQNTTISIKDYDRFSKESIESDQYNGLMAVVDMLCEIEGITDVTPYKNLFVKELVND